MSVRGETCLFCLDGTDSGKLIKNIKCSCKYCYHASCFEKYERKTICPICKKDVTVSHVAIRVQPPPETQSRLNVISELPTNRTPLIAAPAASPTPPGNDMTTKIGKLICVALIGVFAIVLMYLVISAIA